MIASWESLSGDAMVAYSMICLGAAPFLSQVAMSGVRWVFFLPLVAIPAYVVLTLLGNMTQRGPVLTFRRMTPIAAGIGWAMTWHIAERLFSIQLRAAQTVAYFIEILSRPSFDWATKCYHHYNSEHCVDFGTTVNQSTTKYHHYPDNFWPAQEFNRYLVRGNSPSAKVPDHWEPNEWYLGHSSDVFEMSIPQFRLVIPHVFIWTFLLGLIVKYPQYMDKAMSFLCHKVPMLLYAVSTMGMTISGLHFTEAQIDESVSEKKLQEDPIDFFADLQGIYRTVLNTADYSSIFTGIVIAASSRVRTGELRLRPALIVFFLTPVPLQLFILNRGCQSTVHEVQPAFRVYETTDETFTFNLLPVCYANVHFGLVWAVFFYAAHFLYTCLGPMIVFFAFIQQAFVDEFPILHNSMTKFNYSMAALFSIPGLVLFLPQGTKIVALGRYLQESAFTQIAAYVAIVLVYGWQNLEKDALKFSRTFAKYSFMVVVPLLTVVPMVLSTKLVAVYDLLITGNDVSKHIDIGVRFVPIPVWIAKLLAYGSLFAPVLIIGLFAAWAVYDLRHRNRLAWVDLFRPTSELYSHQNIVNPDRKPAPTAYIVIKKLLQMPLNQASHTLIATEAIFCIFVCLAFFANSTAIIGIHALSSRNDYRTTLLLMFLTVHVFSLFEMQKAHLLKDSPNRLNLYIGVAVMETAILNAYMLMYGTDHSWGLDYMPLLIILINTGCRGTLIAVAVALREEMIRSNQQRGPSRARDLVDEADVVDGEDDSPVVFELSRP